MRETKEERPSNFLPATDLRLVFRSFPPRNLEAIPTRHLSCQELQRPSVPSPRRRPSSKNICIHPPTTPLSFQRGMGRVRAASAVSERMVTNRNQTNARVLYQKEHLVSSPSGRDAKRRVPGTRTRRGAAEQAGYRYPYRCKCFQGRALYSTGTRVL